MTATTGIDQLRKERGEEVTFADVADHLADFTRRRPETKETIDGLAAFLAGAEDVPHDHDKGTGGLD